MKYQSSFNFNSSSNKNPFNSILSLLTIIGVLIVLFLVIRGFVSLLYLVAPVLLIITLIIRYRVVADYAISLFETFQTDILMGILKVAFTFVCYPFVIGWLFIKALFYRKMDQVKQSMDSQTIYQQSSDQYADYEEVSSQPSNKEPEKPIIIELPQPKEKNNPYNDLFENGGN